MPIEIKSVEQRLVNSKIIKPCLKVEKERIVSISLHSPFFEFVYASFKLYSTAQLCAKLELSDYGRKFLLDQFRSRISFCYSNQATNAYFLLLTSDSLPQVSDLLRKPITNHLLISIDWKQLIHIDKTMKHISAW